MIGMVGGQEKERAPAAACTACPGGLARVPQAHVDGQLALDAAQGPGSIWPLARCRWITTSVGFPGY